MRTISVTLKRKQPRNPQICLISNVLFIRPFTTALRISKHTKLTTTPLMGDSSVVFAQKIMPQSICIANTLPKYILARNTNADLPVVENGSKLNRLMILMNQATKCLYQLIQKLILFGNVVTKCLTHLISLRFTN